MQSNLMYLFYFNKYLDVIQLNLFSHSLLLYLDSISLKPSWLHCIDCLDRMCAKNSLYIFYMHKDNHSWWLYTWFFGTVVFWLLIFFNLLLIASANGRASGETSYWPSFTNVRFIAKKNLVEAILLFYMTIFVFIYLSLYVVFAFVGRSWDLLYLS